MELIEFESKRRLRREEAAAWLRQLADSLERHNDVAFVRDGVRFNVSVPNEMEMEVELEIEADETSLEIELKW